MLPVELDPPEAARPEQPLVVPQAQPALGLVAGTAHTVQSVIAFFVVLVVPAVLAVPVQGVTAYAVTH